MPNREIFNTVKLESCIRAQVLTATTNGASVNMSDAGSVNVSIDVGNSGDTLSGSVYWTFTAQESADDSSWSTITDAESLLVAIDGAKQASATSVVIDAPTEDQKILEFTYKVPGSKKYFRVVATATGTHTNGTPMSAVAIKGHLKVSPEAGKANA